MPVNLLPKSEQKEIRFELISRQLVNFWLWLVLSLVVLLILSLLAVFQLKLMARQVDGEIDKNRQALSSASNQELQKQVLLLNNEIGKINQLRESHYQWSEALIELGSIIPGDLVVDILTLDRISGKVEITGFAGDRESIIKFWSAMHKSQYFKNINFPLSNLEQARNAHYQFTFYINEDKITP
ncbi:MAG: PilN domain-containing protein [Candidatus Doudnabacteria bacterium]|nr:PilN domain-containing protein [Candidatus Doudnabacteria bacterium]